MALSAIDINGMIQRGRDERMRQNAAEPMNLLSGEQFLWRAEADEWCAIRFDAEETSLVEYNGDIATAADIEFLSIRETSLGWSGTWRLTYYNGAKEGEFKYSQSAVTGICEIESDALPTYERYSLVLKP